MSGKQVEDNPTKQVVGGSKRRHDEDEGTSGPVSKSARISMMPPEISQVLWDKGAPSGLVDKQDSNNKELVTTRRKGHVGRTETDSGVPQAFKYRKAVNNREVPPTVFTLTKAKRNEVMYREGLRRLEGDVDDEDPNAESSDYEDGDTRMGEGSTNPTTSSASKGKGKEKEKGKKSKGKGREKGKAKPCPNCNKLGHILRQCAGPPANDGYMHGCPVHNTMGHNYDECKSVKDTFRMHDHFHMLIMCRVGLPPVLTKIDLREIAAAFPAYRGYPLTAEESNSTSGERFENYDYSLDAEQSQLWSESTTGTLERIQENWATLTESPMGQAAPGAVTSQNDEQPEHTMDIDGEGEVGEPIAAAPDVTAANLVSVSVEEDEEVSIIHSMSSDEEDVRSDGKDQTMYFS